MIDFRKIQAFEDGPKPRVKVRKFMRGVTSKHEKGWRCSLGYDKYCSYYSAGFDTGRFLGSTLNRKFSKDAKDYEKKNLAAIQRNPIALASKGIDWAFVDSAKDYFDNERSIREIKENALSRRANKVTEGIDRNGIPYSLRRDENRIHKFSSRSRAKVRAKAISLYRACRSQKTFVTLTFISKIRDVEAIGILNKFLTACRDKYKDFDYLWVAERQLETTNNIHFHMICNRRLPVAIFNPLWVKMQYNSGLVGKNKDGFVIPENVIDAAIKAKTIGKVLNPFDVKSIKDVNTLGRYLTKYITKKSDNDGGFGCANWGCSRRVSRLFTRALCGPGAGEKCMKLSNWRVDTKTGEMFEPIKSVGLFWLSIPVNNQSVVLEDLKEMEKVNEWILRGEGVFPDWSHFETLDDDEYSRVHLKPFFSNKKNLDYAD